MIIGLLAATLGVLAFMPQAYKTVKTKSASDFSWGWLFLLMGSLTCWIIYGVIRVDWPIIICNALIGAALAVMIFIKWRH